VLRTAFLIGWIVNQVSEFSLIIGNMAYQVDILQLLCAYIYIQMYVCMYTHIYMYVYECVCILI